MDREDRNVMSKILISWVCSWCVCEQITVMSSAVHKCRYLQQQQTLKIHNDATHLE